MTELANTLIYRRRHGTGTDETDLGGATYKRN